MFGLGIVFLGCFCFIGDFECVKLFVFYDKVLLIVGNGVVCLCGDLVFNFNYINDEKLLWDCGWVLICLFWIVDWIGGMVVELVCMWVLLEMEGWVFLDFYYYYLRLDKFQFLDVCFDKIVLDV